MLYSFRDHVILDVRISLILWILYIFTRHTSINVATFIIAYLYFVITVSSLESLRRIKLPGDYSYGIYLWGFVVQQTFATYVQHIDSLVSLLVTMPITLTIAMLSWHFVENPSLRIVHRWVKSHSSGDGAGNLDSGISRATGL